MDDEDLADAAEAQHLETSDAFSGLGGPVSDNTRHVDLFQTAGDTIGRKLLRKMGWKDGQGVGARVWRTAELGEATADTTLHSFAPSDTHLINFLRKIDRKGLGYQSEGGSLRGSSSKATAGPDSGDESSGALSTPTLARQAPAKQKPLRTGLGVGILNDSGSDDDAYNMGPKISYTKVVGGDKKSKKKSAMPRTANPLLGTRPVFRSKKQLESKTGLRRGHDGRLPLAGFVLVETLDSSSDGMGKGEQYPLPEIPEGWKSAKTTSFSQSAGETYLSTADAAKASKLDAKSRAELLGESLLPGKSVFDFISSTARDRLAKATGRSNLPAGLGEMPAADALPDRLDDSMLPPLNKEIALAALGRGVGGWMPYADNEDKRLRYRVFMEYCGGLRQQMPDRPADVAMDAWLQELREFAHAAEVFKPMTGMMASRFTSASTLPGSGSAADAPLLSTPTAASKPEDPAEAAAKLGMFGPLTRSAYRFFPTRLVCKRFNVPPPVHADEAGEASGAQGHRSAVAATSELVAASTMEQMREDVTRSHPTSLAAASSPDLLAEGKTEAGAARADLRPDRVDVSHNEALEAVKPGEAVFKAIFGDDSDSE